LAEVVEQGDLSRRKEFVSSGLREHMKWWCTYDAVVGAALAAEGEWLVVFAAVIDDTVREHGLIGDAEDEDAEGEILCRLGVTPHIY
jgi:hypothetical protein